MSDEESESWSVHSSGLPDTTSSPLAEHLVETIGAIGKLEALILDADRGEAKGCRRKLDHLKARVAALEFPPDREPLGFR